MLIDERYSGIRKILERMGLAILIQPSLNGLGVQSLYGVLVISSTRVADTGEKPQNPIRVSQLQPLC